MLVFCDGFDHYVTAQFTSGQKWDVNSANNAISATAARTGGQGALLSWGQMVKNLPNQATYIVGHALDLVTAEPSGAFTNIITFYDGGTSQVTLSIDNTGHFVVKRGGTVLGTSTATMGLAQYRYVEMKVTVSTTVGAVTVRLDGGVVLTLTGVNTQASANAQINSIAFGSQTQFAKTYIDDLYICDTTTPNSAGNNNNDFLGDVKITAMYPNAAGGFTQYTRGGTDSGQDYSQVNEASPDEDGKYIVDSTINDRDSFKFPAVVLVGQIYAAVVWTRARKDDASTRALSNVARSSAVDAVGASYTLSSTYQYYGTIYELDPATTVRWASAGLNLAEFGVKTIT